MGRKKKKPPQLLRGQVEDLNHDGMGVVRVEGKVWFVDGTLPGEEISFLTGFSRRSHGIGTLEEVHSESELRTTPPCEYFGVCGGCALQHMDPTAQIKHKQAYVIDQLSRIGHVVPQSVYEPLSLSSRHYRRRARLGVRDVEKKGGVLVGFRERRKSYVTHLTHCLTMHEKGQALLPHLSTLVSLLSVRRRVPQIEVSVADNATAVVFRHLDPLNDSDIEELKIFAVTHNVQLFTQSGGLDTVSLLYPENAPALYFTHQQFDVAIEFGPTDFIQVNGAVNEAMVALAIEMLELQPGETVLDLFCGLGNFSLPLAKSGARVIGIEGETTLVQRARDNARNNQLSGCEFYCADLNDVDAVGQHLHNASYKLLLDPPRSGAMEVVKAAGQANLQRIVYVSCNPATLARDAGILVNTHGYTMESVRVINMFPHTNHIESMAVFSTASH